MKTMVFSVAVSRSQSPLTGLAVFGFNYEPAGMFIYDPFLSECGRFEVDPEKEFGLPKDEAEQLVQLNTAIEAGTDEGLRAVARLLGLGSSVPVLDETITREERSEAVANYIESQVTFLLLKRCPFCGSSAKLEELGDHHGLYHNLGCSDAKCPAHQLIYTEADAPVSESIDWWNTRSGG